MRPLEPPLGVSGGLGLLNGVLCRGPRAFGGVDARGGAPWPFWGCLHSPAPAVPMGEPAPARRGRGTRAEPREMPINSLRTRVSPLCHLALPMRCVRVSCCPTGLVAPGKDLAKGCQRCWVEPRRVQGAVVAVSCVSPSQWGLELLGDGVRGQDTPLHWDSGHCQQQPWHRGCFTAALSCSALQAWQENPGEAFRFHHLSPAGAGGGEGSATDGAGKTPAPCQGLPGLWNLHGHCHSTREPLEATSWPWARGAFCRCCFWGPVPAAPPCTGRTGLQWWPCC